MAELSQCMWLRTTIAHVCSHVAAARAAGIVCVSAQLRDRLITHAARERAVVLPGGVSLSQFPLIPRDVARVELGWTPDEQVVLFNAGWQPDIKRADLARAAFALVRAAVPGARLVVLDGDTRQSHVSHYMNAADCLIVTSDFEGSPNIVKEALACNLPVVSTATGDVLERLAGVSPSAVVESSPVAISRAVIGILASPARSNGRAAVERDLREEMLAERLIAYYRQVLERARGG